MNVHKICISLVLSLGLFLAENATCHSQSIAESHAASALIARFEIVEYTSSELFRLPAPSNSIVDARDELFDPFSEMIVALQALGPRKDTDIENAYHSVLVGAVDFGGPFGLGPGPHGLGPVSSRKCYCSAS